MWEEPNERRSASRVPRSARPLGASRVSRAARFARAARRRCGWGSGGALRRTGPTSGSFDPPAREPQVVADEASARAELMHFQDGYPVSLEWDYVMELRRRASSVGRRATEGQIPRGRARRVWIDKGEKSARRATEGRVRAV